MNNYLSNAKKEVSMALIINFGITALMGIILVVAYKKIPTTSTSDFAVVQMLYPAFATIITIKYFNKGKIDKELNIFFNVFIATTIVSIISLLVCTFFFNDNPKILSCIIQGIVTISNIIFIMLIFSNENNSFKRFNLKFTKNFKKVVIILLIFISLFMITTCIALVHDNSITFKFSTLIIHLITLPVLLVFNLFFEFIMFFGEEFGWRGYLQPRLQSIFGKRLGVLILGAIWGIWHLPLCFTLYSPETPIYCVIAHIAHCILLSIFLGYAYMKTENLWAPILIHLINNNFAGIFSGGNYEATFELETLLVGIAINVIIFVPFIFTKEYKKNIGKQAQI
ncbi:CPBP family intramembrane glutamic endopeptidase [Clostridium senegalense]|uniref:CPBP family intramembrane glutamic endopeptidase n=1 Tax=Clostridium senegalense TaxID=1465809 RepID=UPI00028965F6|nr:type II CAAX endopeptidase family protein [Clostridium senegalense]